jgi:Arc/MetJ-type ribon-helix-helix transcriptional regulator
MASVRVTVRIPQDLHRAIQEEGRKVSDVVREALQEHVGKTHRQETALDVAKRLGLVGIAKKAPRDLSTNRRYFRGFGK